MSEQQYVGAFPAKRFFVEMLTRDIELIDAILDLIDNCLDGAIRTIGKAHLEDETPYKGFYTEITLNENSFTIKDNCGGISREIAQKSAFRMGRPADDIDKDLPTVGVYGIGMKRAIFKLGSQSDIITKTDNDSFSVSIKKEWLESDEDWNLPISTPPIRELESNGTEITIEELKPGIARLFSNENDFINDLMNSVSSYYSFIIEKGFVVKINDTIIKPNINKLVIDPSFLDKDEAMAPYLYENTIDGVKVKLSVGFYRGFTTDSEEDELNSGKATTERAGWTVICNDRIVLFGDKSRKTGWGEAGVAQYHTQFIAISGVVIFESTDPSKLPLTTTKRGIEGNSDLYLTVKEYMREGLKIFTSFTNKWKKYRQESEKSALQIPTTTKTSKEIYNEFPSDKWSTIRKSTGGKVFRPNLPIPRTNDPTRQIRYSKKITDIETVSEFLFGDRDRSPNEVGERCFDYIIQEIE
ncbi:ATP-binding protein [Salmonella enterica subsp. salamae]|uniref:ATP-binding protein n=1 Tax=Enterobacteriaceae TaxID=543 RepID=UPI0003BBF83E|nr:MULTISPECIES: ATP-binding protein [Enterobacteriaceae]EAA6221733.1 ATP-binding protein [Salmonella enterica subsp. salamae]EBL7633398.1 ATP-binding protein [Salmonella enterica]EBZ2011922.1 ATP-binding protein [Salmonella enterica subsp. enterica serovar Newport]ECF6083276.1 ATP-binding protein [Salmonella enterica subsp. houtenae]EHG6069238.1 ATP-binding protein [Salmonella enterica subsp. diarizonae serovar 61:z52:z53]MDD8674886.1 ATP-binding protein [Escherichia coli]